MGWLRLVDVVKQHLQFAVHAEAEAVHAEAEAVHAEGILLNLLNVYYFI